DTIVPDFRSESPMLSDLVIGYGSEKIQAEAGGMRAFQVGENAIEPAPGSVFTAGEVLHLAFKAVGATSGGESLRMTLANGEETLFDRTRSLSDYPRGEVVERFSLLEIEGGRYQVGVVLRDRSGTRLASRSAEITVSPRSSIPRPRLVRRSSFASHVPGQVALALGNQLLGLGRFDEAVKMLERSVDAEGSELPAAKWQLASALLETGEPERARTLLKSLEPEFGDRFEVVAGLGHAAYQTGSYSEAVRYFERAIDLSPAGRSLLNALGESHVRLGQLDLARTALERSLELDPQQPRVKELLEELLRSSSRNR
ncbi:MAG: tetratricopeptide repeat protein, partial [Vicinamibacteria bacterium]